MPVLLVLFALLTGSAVRAEPVKIAVPDMKVSGAEKSLGSILTEVMTTETSQLGNTSVVGSSDIRSMLGFEQQKELLGCSDDVSCMAEIGGALGVDFLLVSDLGRVGGTHVINLKLIDTTQVKVVNRLYETVVRTDDLIPAVRAAVPQLLGVVIGGPPEKSAVVEPPISAEKVEPAPDPARIPEPVAAAVGEVEGPASWPAWTLISAGAVATGLGVAGVVSAKDDYDKASLNYETGGVLIHSPSTLELYNQASTFGTMGVVLLIAGGGMVAGGIVWLLALPGGEAAISAVPIVNDRGAAMVVGGTF